MCDLAFLALGIYFVKLVVNKFVTRNVSPDGPGEGYRRCTFSCVLNLYLLSKMETSILKMWVFLFFKLRLSANS